MSAVISHGDSEDRLAFPTGNEDEYEGTTEH